MCIRTVALMILPFFFVLGCEDEDEEREEEHEGPEARVIPGEEQLLFGQELESWAVVDEDERVVAVGFTLPEEAVQAATGQNAADVVLALPPEVRDQTVLDHIAVDWEPAGHPPAVFQVPHFDFIFSMIPVDAAAAIDCTDATAPTAAEVPPGYIFAPPGTPILASCVPRVGLRAFPESALKEPFTATVALGYYHGEQISILPMVTREQLLAEQSFALDVPVPAAVELASGRLYPRQFRADWDPETGSYDIVLTSFAAVQ